MNVDDQDSHTPQSCRKKSARSVTDGEPRKLSSMAAEIVNPEGKRKRKKLPNRPKLLVNERVEVRSVEEGFHGSWHSGTVIACENRARRIKYDHLICDNGSQHLIESIKVSPIVDGIIPASRDLCNYRGMIRPLPPLHDCQKCALHYGLCVDVYYEEAWWEGVIFDSEDGSEGRTVFFPDMGDEMQFGVDKFRLTHDWDEFTEEWKPRGDWLFLDLVKEFEQHWPLQVSVRQIWYEVRGKKSFQKLEQWTSTNRGIWNNLVWDVIVDNCHISVHHFFRELELSGDLIQEALPPFSELHLDDAEAGSRKNHNNDFTSIKEDGRNDVNLISNSDMTYNEETTPKQDESCGLYSNSKSFASQSKRKSSSSWRPAGLDVVPRLEFCPNSVAEYCSRNNGDPSQLRMHLAYLGWKIESRSNGSIVRMRYTSPDGKSYYSLVKVCEALIDPAMSGDLIQEALPPFSELHLDDDEAGSRKNHNNDFTSIKEDGRNDVNLISNSDMTYNEETTPKQDESCGLYSNSKSFASQRKRKSSSSWRPAGLDVVPRLEFCPNSVAEYFSRNNADPSQLRIHLAYLGWKIESRSDGSIVRMRYTSPDGKSYYSLVKVCEALIDLALEIIPFSSPDNTIISSASSERQFSSPISKQPHARQKPSSSDIVVEPEYCPQAIVDYAKKKDKHLKYEVKVLRLRAKKHLSAIGWSLWYFMKRGGSGRGSGRELRYSSPSGRCYYSLRDACKGCLTEGGLSGTNTHESRPNISEEAMRLLASERLSSELSDVESGKDCLVKLAGISLSRKLVGRKAHNQMLKKRKTSRSLIKLGDDLGSEFPVRVLRSSKRARLGMTSSSSYQNSQTVLSWLIENNVVLPRAKVCYISRKDNHKMAEGRITRDGIRCSCCNNVFTLSKFEAHAGSTYHRPAANIFLEDGRSLLDCQSEMESRNSKKNMVMEPHEMESRHHHGSNDYICTVCHAGGDLILCDQCPSSFHTSCLGMKDVPDGDWFCPSCCCGICGRSRLNNDTGRFSDVSVLSCVQCQHQYHVGCLRERGVAIVDNHPKGNWFCSIKCKKISLGLHKLLGKPVSIGNDNVTWTLLKYIKYDPDDRFGCDIEALTENYSKLNVALSVMHECFEPLKEPGTRRDLVEDVIFGRWSELHRLNFRGFYTVLLERDDELISAATVRVHGEKVAEVPLVGTRFKYRRLGMCRVLMNELEKNCEVHFYVFTYDAPGHSSLVDEYDKYQAKCKKLLELGVERLVLPAVPNVLKTWTTSFGFAKMTNEERLNFLDYTFLDFEGTVMCQKLLRKIPSTDLRLIIRSQPKIHDVVSGCDGRDLDGNSAISESFQADKVEKSEIVDQEPSDIARDDDGSDGSTITEPPGFELNRPDLEWKPFQNGYREWQNKDNGVFKCYKRRRISDCRS